VHAGTAEDGDAPITCRVTNHDENAQLVPEKLNAQSEPAIHETVAESPNEDCPGTGDSEIEYGLVAANDTAALLLPVASEHTSVTENVYLLLSSVGSNVETQLFALLLLVKVHTKGVEGVDEPCLSYLMIHEANNPVPRPPSPQLNDPGVHDTITLLEVSTPTLTLVGVLLMHNPLQGEANSHGKDCVESHANRLFVEEQDARATGLLARLPTNLLPEIDNDFNAGAVPSDAGRVPVN
jgi:hypothetical protein